MFKPSGIKKHQIKSRKKSHGGFSHIRLLYIKHYGLSEDYQPLNRNAKSNLIFPSREKKAETH